MIGGEQAQQTWSRSSAGSAPSIGAYPVMMAVPANMTLVTGGIELKTAEKSAMMYT
jgi:hypothetical protein